MGGCGGEAWAGGRRAWPGAGDAGRGGGRANYPPPWGSEGRGAAGCSGGVRGRWLRRCLSPSPVRRGHRGWGLMASYGVSCVCFPPPAAVCPGGGLALGQGHLCLPRPRYRWQRRLAGEVPVGGGEGGGGEGPGPARPWSRGSESPGVGGGRNAAQRASGQRPAAFVPLRLNLLRNPESSLFIGLPASLRGGEGPHPAPARERLLIQPPPFQRLRLHHH